MAAALRALGAVGGARPATGQVAPTAQHRIERRLESGSLVNHGPERGPIFSALVHEPGASWLRLEFADVVLGARPAGGEHTVIRVSSLADGAVQHLNALHVGQWGETSAYFNGDAVLVEIVADPGAAPSRLKVIGGWAGEAAPGEIAQTLCGADDRLLSNVDRIGRAMPIGCTAWIINDANHCLLSAGHCVGGSFSVMQFNVPLSTPGGVYQNPGPEDQYAIDPVSIQTQSGSPSLGDDFAYFGCFANTETGLTPFQAQLDSFALDFTPPVPTGQAIDVTGYGTTEFPIPNEWNGAQKVHVGPLTVASGSVVRYVVDTTGGNSGSPVLDLETGEAIAIHTNGGCTESGGANIGCGLNNTSLLAALADPQGVCLPLELLEFTVTGGLPAVIAPEDGTLEVVVSGANGGQPEPGTGMLHVNAGHGFVGYPMVETAPNVYQAEFPSLECPSEVAYYFSAEVTGGQRFFDPPTAPIGWHVAGVAYDAQDLFADDFEGDLGWTVENDGGLTDGAWDRGVPAGDGDRGDPTSDADGSGQCYLTDNVEGNSDVDGGTTTLVSPLLDAADPDAWLVYDRWYSNTAGDNPEQDVFVVEVSDDDGAAWAVLETVGPAGEEVNGQWFHRQWKIAEIPGITGSVLFRVRFSASDLGAGSVVEAAVDGVRVVRFDCTGCPPADLDGDCLVGFNDLLLLLGEWGDCEDGAACPADLDGNGNVGFGDLLELLGAWD